MWDPDGDGPQTSRVLVAGVLGATYSPGSKVVEFSDGGWRRLSANVLDSQGSVYSMMTFREPGALSESIFVGCNNGALLRCHDGIWTQIGLVSTPREMVVGDLDGPNGPEPECLFIAGSAGVFQWDGVLLRQLVGGQSVANGCGLYVWDEDGAGPQSPRLYVGTTGTAPRRLSTWSGSSWVNIITLTDPCYEITSFDFDGDGPGLPDLLVGQSGYVKRWSQGVWSTVGTVPANPSGAIYSMTTFDPDGDGPTQPWLVAGGSFSELGGVAAFRVAAYYENEWHPFPAYVTGLYVASLDVATNLPFSDTPQLLIACISSRPCIGRFGLCDSPAGITGNAPTRSRQPEGQSATFDVIPSGDELTFRWYKGETALVDGATAHGSTISGVYGPRLTIANVRAQDIGQYHAKVFNPLGQARSRDVALTVGCTADFNLDSTVDVSDYLDFITTFATNDPDADFNADRTIDFFDYLDFVNQFASGC